MCCTTPLKRYVVWLVKSKVKMQRIKTSKKYLPVFVRTKQQCWDLLQIVTTSTQGCYFALGQY